MKQNIKKGLETTEKIWGVPRGDLIDELGELGEYIIDIAFGDVYARPGLALRDREMITVAMLIAQGGADEQLRNHFMGALNVGVTKEELLEVILQASLYNGFPKAIKALKILKHVTE